MSHKNHRRNFIAKELRESKKYGQRIEKDRTKYDRKRAGFEREDYDWGDESLPSNISRDVYDGSSTND